MKRRIITSLLVIMSFFALCEPITAANEIKKVNYEGNGIVEVDFRTKVSYKNAKVVVKDNTGKVYTTKIIEKDNDDLDFCALNLKSGTTYTFTISGVKVGRAKNYGSLSGTFKTPKAASGVSIKKIDCDIKDKELEIEFSSKVQYKNLKVTVKDNTGKTYTCRITDRDSDEIEVRVQGLKRGTTYTVTVSGVRLKGKTQYQTITKTFKAR